jgi:hypothetical protein
VVSQTEIEFVYKNLIYFALLEHRQEYRNEHFRTPDGALVVRNILSFYTQILSQYVQPPSYTLPNISGFIIIVFSVKRNKESLVIVFKIIYVFIDFRTILSL